MAYRTLRQGASEASMPEDRADYVDYESTPEGRAKANLLALGMGGLGGLAAKGVSMLPSAANVGGQSLRQWLARQGVRSAAPEAVLMEPAAGTAARDAIVRGSVMSPRTAGATIAAGVPMAMPFVPGANYPAAKEPVAYDMDAPPAPRQNFDEFGHKIMGPSAATSSMDAPPDAVSSAMRVLRAPTPPRRSEPVQQTQAAAPSPQSLWEKYNETGNAADFVRADRAMMEAKKAQEETGKAKGGSVNGKDAALHKALEIIHHLLTRGH
jgi:hypothetical protein